MDSPESPRMLYRVTTQVPGCPEQFVDWYDAPDKSAARELWAKDAAQFLPPNATIANIEHVAAPCVS